MVVKCDSKRQKAGKHVTETDTFTSIVTGKSFKINHQFDGHDKCLVYLLTCSKCKKQYTSETTGQFSSRWNSYKSKSRSFDRGEECKREHLYKHFENKSHSGFCDNFSVKLINNTDGFNPIKRKIWWMRLLKTI